MQINEKQKNMQKIKMVSIAVMAALTFILSCYMVISILTTAAKEKNAFDELRNTVAQTEVTECSSSDAQNTVSDSSVRSVLPEYAALYEQNSDLFGWLRIDGTGVDYPVMQTPNDPQYYLKRAFDKSSSNSGTPFLDGQCTEYGGIYIVYGHRMSNGSMFGKLADYADRQYWKKHKTIHFDTLYEHGEYEVMSVFYSRVFGSFEKAFRYYGYTDLTDEETFDNYVTQIMKKALYDTGITAEYGDQILVLSTCNYHITDGRFVVVARKK